MTGLEAVVLVMIISLPGGRVTIFEPGHDVRERRNPSGGMLIRFQVRVLNYAAFRLRYVMPRTSRNTRWPTFASLSRTCSQTQQRATTPGHCIYKCASAKRLFAPQWAHCPSAAVTSIANILLNSPAAALPSR